MTDDKITPQQETIFHKISELNTTANEISDLVYELYKKIYGKILPDIDEKANDEGDGFIPTIRTDLAILEIELDYIKENLQKLTNNISEEVKLEQTNK